VDAVQEEGSGVDLITGRHALGLYARALRKVRQDATYIPVQDIK
jgi:hypothetical protein